MDMESSTVMHKMSPNKIPPLEFATILGCTPQMTLGSIVSNNLAVAMQDEQDAQAEVFEQGFRMSLSTLLLSGRRQGHSRGAPLYTNQR